MEVDSHPNSRSKEFKNKIAKIRELLPITGRDASAARHCFELLKVV
jgi:hypothetical protein